jgi:hypothetical protein
MAKKISLVDNYELLKLKRKDINMSLLKDYFAVRFNQKEPRFNTNDKFNLKKGTLFNEEDTETTIGRYLFNMFVLPEKFLKKFGYQNTVMDKRGISQLEAKLGSMLMNSEITTKEMAEYLNRGEWLLMGTAYFLTPTMNYDISVPIPEVIARRDELFKKYAKEIEEGDPNVADLIEKELLTLAKKILKEKGNEAYDFFLSGEFNFDNNYKKTSIFAGALENPYTKKLDILKSNYVDGISKEDFDKLANLTIIGGYSRNVETQKGGYSTKKINNATQVIVLDEAGTDCGTTNFLKVSIPNDMRNMFMGRWVLDGGKLVEITQNNIAKFLGKEVHMRSPMFCKSEKICNKCAGESFYKLGIMNAGLLSSTLSGNLMNMSMKKFHNTSIKFSKIDVNEYIKER